MRLIACLVLPLAALLAAGCSDGTSRVPVYPVEGQVLINGKPPVGAQVIFHPVGRTGVQAVCAAGQVDATGKFTLTTLAANDGAPAGAYDVTVEWWLAKNDRPAVNLLPARYRQAGSSGLRATVVAESNVLPTFKLSR